MGAGVWLWLVWTVGCRFGSLFFVILLGKQLVIEHVFEYSGGMELGDQTAGVRAERSRLDVILDKLNDDFAELLDTVETGGLDQLNAAEKISWWQRFETFRNRLPLIDHSLIADAEASDLAPGRYCSSTLTQFLMRMFQLSASEAASPGPGRRRGRTADVDAGGTIGTFATSARCCATCRCRHRGEGADCGAGHAETVPTRLEPRCCRDCGEAAHDYAPVFGPTDLHRFALQVVDAADPDGPEPVDDQLQQDRRHLDLKQRRDGMWALQGRLTGTLGAQLNAILDPLARHRSSSIEDEDGTTTQIPDERPSGQRLHDALDEACGRLLKTKDQPLIGGIPASVIITVQLEDLLAKTGLAETTDGTVLTAEQLLRIADEAEIWPTIIDRHGVPLALGRTRRLASARPNHGPDRPRRRLLIPRLHPPTQLVRQTPHCRLDSRRPN